MVFRNVSEAALHQFFDKRTHLRDMLGGARLDRRAQAAERFDIVVKLFFGPFGDLADRLVQRQAGKIPRGALVDLVIDIGDVADIFDVSFAVEVPQQAEQHVEHDHRARVADMSEVVDRRPQTYMRTLSGSSGTKGRFSRVNVS